MLQYCCVLPCTASPSAWRCLWTEKVGKAVVTPQFEEDLDEEDTSYFMVTFGINRLACWFRCSRKIRPNPLAWLFLFPSLFPCFKPCSWTEKTEPEDKGRALIYQWLYNIPKGRDVPRWFCSGLQFHKHIILYLPCC